MTARLAPRAGLGNGIHPCRRMRACHALLCQFRQLVVQYTELRHQIELLMSRHRNQDRYLLELPQGSGASR